MKKVYTFSIAVFICTLCFSQTTIFNISGGGTEPSGWSLSNIINTYEIDRATYYLLEAGAPGDVLTTAIYDVSKFNTVSFSVDVATFDSGSNNAAKIEISYDGGITFNHAETTAVPTSSIPYITGGVFNLTGTSSQVQIRISNKGSSGKGVRLRNLKLYSNDIIPSTKSLMITGIFDGPRSGGTPKGIELYAINDIPDLSIFGIGSANNGGGSDGEEFTFPSVALTQGSYIYVSSESTEFFNFFGFTPDYTHGTTLNINGDDAIELFERGVVIDLFGSINIDGTGQAWEYLDGWAYRNSSGPSTNFSVTEWDFSGMNSFDNEITNASSFKPFPIATMHETLGVVKNEIDGFSMYPNPVNRGKVFFSTNSKHFKQIEIYGSNGMLLVEKTIQDQEPVDISNFKVGVYIVRILEDGKVATRKIIIQN